MASCPAGGGSVPDFSCRIKGHDPNPMGWKPCQPTHVKNKQTHTHTEKDWYTRLRLTWIVLFENTASIHGLGFPWPICYQQEVVICTRCNVCNIFLSSVQDLQHVLTDEYEFDTLPRVPHKTGSNHGPVLGCCSKCCKASALGIVLVQRMKLIMCDNVVYFCCLECDCSLLVNLRAKELTSRLCFSIERGRMYSSNAQERCFIS